MSFQLQNRRARPSRWTTTTTASVVLFALGLWAAVSMLGGRPETTGSIRAFTGPGPFVSGQPVRAFGGVLTLTGQDNLAGLTARDLAGATHGIPHLVQVGSVQIQLTLRLTNDTTRPLDFRAAQLRLQAGDHVPVPPSSSTMPDGPIGAGVSVEGTFGFVVAQDGSIVTLRAPGPGGTTSITVGRTSVVDTTEQRHSQH